MRIDEGWVRKTFTLCTGNPSHLFYFYVYLTLLHKSIKTLYTDVCVSLWSLAWCNNHFIGSFCLAAETSIDHHLSLKTKHLPSPQCPRSAAHIKTTKITIKTTPPRPESQHQTQHLIPHIQRNISRLLLQPASLTLIPSPFSLLLYHSNSSCPVAEWPIEETSLDSWISISHWHMNQTDLLACLDEAPGW